MIEDQLKQFFEILPTLEQLKHVHLLLEVEKEKYETLISNLKFSNTLMEGDLTHITTEKLDLTATFKEYRDYTTKKLDEREVALNTFKAELRST